VHVSGITAHPVGEWVTQQALDLSFAPGWTRPPDQFLGPGPRCQVHRQLETVLNEFIAHDNGHRPHRSLAQHAPLGV